MAVERSRKENGSLVVNLPCSADIIPDTPLEELVRESRNKSRILAKPPAYGLARNTLGNTSGKACIGDDQARRTFDAFDLAGRQESSLKNPSRLVLMLRIEASMAAIVDQVELTRQQ